MNFKVVLIIVGYVLAINLMGFAAMYIDKMRAKKNQWRIKERTLLTIALLGGGIGGMIGMYKFRHKTQKIKFTIGFPTILGVQIVLIIYCLIANPLQIWYIVGNKG